MEKSKDNQRSATQKILLAIKGLSKKTDERFDEVFLTIKGLSKKTDQRFNEVFLAIKGLSKKTDERFDEVFLTIKGLSKKTDQRFNEVFEVISFIKDNTVVKTETVTKEEFNGLKNDVSQIKTTMVTKDYLDEKLTDSRGDMVVMMRKEDKKLKTLVGVLAEKKVLNSKDVKRIYSLEPFAQ